MKNVYRDIAINNKTIAANGRYTSNIIAVGSQANNGEFALVYHLAGSGTAKFECLMSDDGVYFYKPSASSDIASGITVSSGSATGMIRSVNFTSGGVLEPVAGDTMTGATGGATATFISVSALSGGTWVGGDAEGTMYVYDQSGTFQSENINAGRQSNILTIGANTAAYTAKDTVLFEPVLSPYLKIRATETGGANAVIVSAWVLHQ